MKVAVACIDEVVSGHFGQSEYFKIYKIENNEPVFVELVKAPEHTHGSLPNFLSTTDIKLLICGNLGTKAIQILNAHEIDVLSGAQGNADDVMSQYAKGTLISLDLSCNGHDHDHECHHDEK